MLISKFKSVVAVLVAVGFIVTGATVLAYRTAASAEGDKPHFVADAEHAAQNQEKDRGAAKEKSGPDDAKNARVDSQGDPLPDQALLRVGTTRLQHQGEMHAVAASEYGRLLASYGSDKVVRVWDAKDGRPVWAFKLRIGGPWTLAFSRNGKELAAVSKSSHKQSANGAFLRWDLTTGQELPNGRDRPALDMRSLYYRYHLALACRDDGEFVAAETDMNGFFRGAPIDDVDIVLYSPDVPKSLTRLKGHIGRVMSVCFTKDARMLVFAGR